jgi:hypothetical protein
MKRQYIPQALRVAEPRIQPTRAVQYAIGIEHAPDEFGMTDGPFETVDDLLETVQSDDRACIIRFNADWTETVLWRWARDRWVSEEDSE